MKLIKGERVDKAESNINCAGCKHKIGRVCAFHKAFLQTNSHRPTDCKDWEPKEYKGEL